MRLGTVRLFRQDAARSASSDSIGDQASRGSPDKAKLSAARGKSPELLPPLRGPPPSRGRLFCSWEAPCESMKLRFSPHLHAELVLHKESVYHFTAPWFRVNFARFEQNFNSGRRTMFCYPFELTKR